MSAAEIFISYTRADHAISDDSSPGELPDEPVAKLPGLTVK